VKGRKAAFWVTVGGVSILAPFTLKLAAHKLPIPGLQRFTSFIFGSPGGS
jgi:hypothetical protein